MQWATPTKSHHSTGTTLSVLALCQTEVETPHIIAIGSNVGTVDIINLESRTSIASYTELHEQDVKYVGFYQKDHILSYDKLTFIHLDTESGNRTILYDKDHPVECITYASEKSRIIGSTRDNILSFDLRAQDPTVLMEQDNITELCLLPDDNTLFGLQFQTLVATDIRRPDKLYSLDVNIKFEKLSCNSEYLAALTDECQLYAFDLPFSPLCYQSLLPFDNPFLFRPAFSGNNIVIGNSDGMIFVIDPKTKNIDMVQSELSTPIFSIAATDSEIAVSYEDDIYVFSQFEYSDIFVQVEDDDNRFESDDNEENEEQNREEWLTQSSTIELDAGECTYERYGYCEQQIYTCFTCSRDVGHPIGICEECSTICHDGHDIRPIGTRRRFRCDCGNNRCPHPCNAMFEPKVSENTLNKYNHNFKHRWCICDGLDQPPMVQCICCDDWFHHECIGFFSDKRCIILEETPSLSNWIFVCNDCLENRLKFLDEYPDTLPPDDILEFVHEMQTDSGIRPGEEGDPSKEGVGFRILGGRWIQKDQFASFAGNPEYDAEFSKLDPTEEDASLPPSRLQKEYGGLMKSIYIDMFKSVASEGRTVIQASDTKEALQKNINRLFMQRRRDHDHDDDDNRVA